MSVRKKVIYIILPALILFWQYASVIAMTHRSEEKLYLWANELSRQPEDPPYLSLYYRFRSSYFSVAPHDNQPIVFLGDSITDEGNWSKLFPNVPIENRGIGGDTTLGVLNRLDQVIALKPTQVFLMIGTNDLCYGRAIPDIISNYERILQRFRTELPGVKIYVQSVLPFNDTVFPARELRTNKNIVQLNREIKHLAMRYDYPYLDITSPFTGPDGRLPMQYSSDGLHLNDTGYLIWRDQIKSLVVPAKFEKI